MRFPHLLAAAALLLLAHALPALAGGAPSETIVLVNDASADSVRVAEHYVAARSIPPTNVCHVRCTSELVTRREDFVRDVVTPLRALLDREVALRGGGTLRDRARFIVLTQGMPIRADGPGGAVSTAEMLALADTNICGQDGARLPRIRNPYTSGVAPGPGPDGEQLFLVTALISSTADEAIALIDRSVASDGTAPANALWVYQDAAGAAGVRNDAYDAARKELEGAGHATEHVGRGQDVVVDRKRVMGYMSGGSYSALSPEGVARNEYLPGAICDMLQSFGAVPQNFGPDGKGGTQFPVTHMVRAGITGVQGTVAEPYNIAFPPADLFTPYAQGFTLAETFHQKIPFRYWMNLVIGDPLCAPYAARPAVSVGKDGVRAAGAVRIEAFVDGISIGVVEGKGELDGLPPGFADGAHTVLYEATGAGPAQPKGWTTREVTQAPSACAPRSLPGRILPGTPLLVPLTRTPAACTATLALEGADVPATATAVPGGVRVDVDPARLAALAGRTLDAKVTLDGAEHAWRLLVGPARLTVVADGTVVAGEPLAIRVVAADAAGQPIPGWAGSVELHGATPPVRWARASFADGAASLRFASPTAGAASLEVRVPGTSLAAPVDVVVQAAAPDHATTPLDRLPLGQATDVPVRVEDRFGNAVSSGPEELEVSFPDDPHARGAGTVRLTGGTGVLRDVILTRPGRQRVVLREARKVWSQPQEGVEVRPDFVRSWLATRAYRGPEAAALFKGDPSEGLRADGGAPGGRLFRRVRDGDSTVDLPAAGSKDGDAAVAVAFVEALDETSASLRIAAAARVRVLLDGKEVFDGVPAETDPRKAPADVAELTLAAGLHRLTVVAERKGRFGFRLALGKDAEPLAPLLRVVAGSDESPASPCVSGRVLRAGERPVEGARVEVAVGGGKPQSAETAADGSWFVTGVGNGDAKVRLVAAPGLSEPLERVVAVSDENVPDVDFRIVDRSAPEVAATAGRGMKAGRTLVIGAEIGDDGGVARAWLEIAGERLSTDVQRGPWRLTADVSGRPRGAVEVVVVAVDAAGNEGRSAPVTVELVDDTEGPHVTLRGISRNATLKKKTTVTATARDDIGVAEVVFLVDDAAQGAPLTAEPYAIDLDPAALGSGRHELVCVARDTDGNETRTTLAFRVK